MTTVVFNRTPHAHPVTTLQDAEAAVRAVRAETTCSPFQVDRRVTHRLESAITAISGALILIDAGGASVLQDDDA